MGSIRSRLSFFVLGVALLTILAVAGILVAVRVSDDALTRLVESQRRLDLLAEMSGRLTDYALAAVDSNGSTPQDQARLEALRDRANAAFAAIDASRGGGDGGSGDAPSGRSLAHLKAEFGSLDTAIRRALQLPDPAARTDAVRGSLNAFALTAGPNLSMLVEVERAAVQDGRQALQRTSSGLAIGAVMAAALVVLAAIAMHRGITRPLLRRIDSIAQATRAVARGDLGLRLPVVSHDELGLVVAQFNRMATTLARRQRRLAEDRAGLERTVAARTADLTAANDKLAEVDRSRRRFFADVSHELRTPLTVVLGECDVALRARSISEEMVRPVLTTIRQRVLRLNRRVEDLLRVARSESGELSLDLRLVELGLIVEEAVAAFESTAAARGIALSASHPDAPVEAWADAEWLRQVIEGLIDNAVRHATGATAISVSLSETIEEAQIIVADDGEGIPLLDKEHVFERFAKAGDAQKSGFGIGLALARWVVSRHNGTIIVTSDPDQKRGTDVRVTLPRTIQGS